MRSSDSAFVPGQLDRGEQPIGSRDVTGGGQRDLFSGGREKNPSKNLLISFFSDVKSFSTCFRHNSFYFIFTDFLFIYDF